MTFVEPAYGGRSLSDVMPAVACALGVDVGYAPVGLELPPAPSYVVMLVDGMGRELLAAHKDHAPYLHGLLNGPGDLGAGTSGVPSTTAVSLTSLGTGLTPGEHGLVGYTSRVPGTDHLLNALQWDKTIEATDWQPHETAFDRLSRAGVVTTTVNKRAFQNSGLTVSSQRGAAFVGGDHVGERIAAAAEASSRAPSMTYLYESDLDWTGHKFGVDSAQWRQQLITVDAQVEQLREALHPSTRIVILADHGMVDSGPNSRVDVDTTEGLRDGVLLLGGEARFRHVYVEDGALDDVLATWREVLGDRALVLPRAEAVQRGWFGAVEDRVLPRLGDVIAATTADNALVSSKDFPYETQLIGMHGSLTGVEMLVPLLVD
ncbi:MAG: alkaline phosphatase family protein [Nocardioidaceae bacterium]|nr:alkaline phosphatase family protein [Nocardioidaceae bacterium]